jgi:hypothetical protein
MRSNLMRTINQLDQKDLVHVSGELIRLTLKGQRFR